MEGSLAGNVAGAPAMVVAGWVLVTKEGKMKKKRKGEKDKGEKKENKKKKKKKKRKRERIDGKGVGGAHVEGSGLDQWRERKGKKERKEWIG